MVKTRFLKLVLTTFGPRRENVQNEFSRDAEKLVFYNTLEAWMQKSSYFTTSQGPGMPKNMYFTTLWKPGIQKSLYFTTFWKPLMHKTSYFTTIRGPGMQKSFYFTEFRRPQVQKTLYFTTLWRPGVQKSSYFTIENLVFYDPGAGFELPGAPNMSTARCLARTFKGIKYPRDCLGQ